MAVSTLRGPLDCRWMEDLSNSELFAYDFSITRAR